MRILLAVCILICAPIRSVALGNNQLYVGDASTVAPGRTQLQLFTDHTRPVKSRLGGAAIRRGLTGNTDVKLAYSYLWNSIGPDAQLGPNVGVKWRFAGDGLRRPSLAVSALCVMNQESGGRSHKSDYGATLIGSCPVGFAYVLVNYGHVWVGDNVPDLRYVGLALARPVFKRTLVALEYADIERLGNGGPPLPKRQVAAGLVYGLGSSCIYSIEIGYLPEGARVKWHTTLGVGMTF